MAMVNNSQSCLMVATSWFWVLLRDDNDNQYPTLVMVLCNGNRDCWGIPGPAVTSRIRVPQTAKYEDAHGCTSICPFMAKVIPKDPSRMSISTRDSQRKPSIFGGSNGQAHGRNHQPSQGLFLHVSSPRAFPRLSTLPFCQSTSCLLPPWEDRSEKAWWEGRPT